MFRAGWKAGFFGAGVIVILQLFTFVFSLLPGTFGVSFSGCFLVIALLVFMGVGALAGQMLGRSTVGRGLGAGGLAGAIAGLAQGFMLTLSVALGGALLYLTGQLATMLNPEDLRALQEHGPVMLALATSIVCLVAGPLFLVVGVVLGALGGAAHAIVVRGSQTPAPALDTLDDEAEEATGAG